MSAVIGALRGVLSLDSAAFDKGAKRAMASMGEMQRRFAMASKQMQAAGRKMSLRVTAPIAGVATVAVKSSLSTIDAQAKMAQSLGTTTKSIQVLSRAGDLAGVSMGQIEQGLVAMTKRLSQAAAGGGPAVKALDKLGLSAEALQKMPADERIVAIQNALAEMVPEAERAAVLAQIFGDRAAISFMRLDPSVIGQSAAEMDRFGVAVSDVDADQIEVTNDAISALGLVTRGLGNQMAVALAPVLQDLAEKAQELGAWFTGLSDSTKRMIVVIGGIAAAVGPALIGFGFIASGVSSLIGAFAMLGPAVAGLASLILSPVGLIAAAIVGLAAAGWYVYQNWETIRPQLVAAWEAIKARAAEIWDGLRQRFSDIMQAIRDRAVEGWQNLKQAFIDGGQWVIDALSGIWERIKSFVAGWAAEFTQIGRDMIQGLINGIKSGASALFGEMNRTTDQVKSDIREKYGIQSPSTWFRQIGQYLMEGLALGVSDGRAGAVDAVTSVADAMAAAAQQRSMIGAAVPVPADGAQGGPANIGAASMQAAEAVRGVGDAMAETGQQSSQMGSMFSSAFSEIVRGAASAENAADKVREVLARMADQLADRLLQSAFNGLFGGLFGGMGGLFGGGFANGAAFSGGRVTAFANGGVVRRPTMFPMDGGAGLMGEAGAEAIMPLTLIGGKLGVQAANARPPDVNVTAAFVRSEDELLELMASPRGRRVIRGVQRQGDR